MKFTVAQEAYAAEMLNAHSKHVEEHWATTLHVIAAELDLTDEQVQELIQTNNVKDMWNL
jgi:hypothetical protein